VSARVHVLLVEPDHSVMSLVRHGLTLEGVEVISADSVDQARVVLDEPFEAAVLSSDLLNHSSGGFLDELLERLPESRIIIHGLQPSFPGLPSVDRGHLAGLLQLLEFERPESPASAALTARQALGRVHRQWIELCHWDPALPPTTRPPIAETVIRAVSNALERPQPLGWGLDPALEPVAAAFSLNVGDVHTALAEMVCLREAFARVVVSQLSGDQQVEALRRLQMIIDRTMLVVASAGVQHLADLALTDPLTGLGNRRSFEQDLHREVARISRSHARLTVGLLDLDGLKQINDTLGHPAGDQQLRHLANSIVSATRASDRGYRIGGDEFAIILVDAVGVEAEDLQKRLAAAGAPKFTIGIASYPPDDPERLVELADERLYDQRREVLTQE
jgi:diguanylate cyclase (GGDEF)-like protein